MTWTEFKTKYNPCHEAVTYIDTLGIEDCREILERLISDGKTFWTIWGIARLLPRTSAAAWAIFCADTVLPIFETKYPDDNRPRKAIEAARSAVILGDAANAADADAVNSAAYAAYAAANAAAAAADAAYAAAAAADAAYAAANAAAADAADAAYAAANAAAYAAADAAYAAANAADADAVNSAAYAAYAAANAAVNSAMGACFNNPAISKVILDEGLRLLEEQSE